MVIWRLGFVITAFLASSCSTVARATDAAAFAPGTATADVSVIPGEACYLADVQTVAIRVSEVDSAKMAAFSEALSIWLPGLDIGAGDDADLLVEWAEYTGGNSAGEWRTVAFLEDLGGIDNREPKPIVSTAQVEQLDHVDGRLLNDHPEISAGQMTDTVSVLPLSEGELSPSVESGDAVYQHDVEELLPTTDVSGVRWTATLFRMDCQSRSFTVKPYRPTDGRCETPVFVRTHLAEVHGVARDHNTAVASLAEVLRELLLGVPRGSEALQP